MKHPSRSFIQRVNVYQTASRAVPTPKSYCVVGYRQATWCTLFLKPIWSILAGSTCQLFLDMGRGHNVIFFFNWNRAIGSIFGSTPHKSRSSDSFPMLKLSCDNRKCHIRSLFWNNQSWKSQLSYRVELGIGFAWLTIDETNLLVMSECSFSFYFRFR